MDGVLPAVGPEFQVMFNNNDIATELRQKCGSDVLIIFNLSSCVRNCMLVVLLFSFKLGLALLFL